MKLDPRTIMQFVTIAEEASFTRAAARLSIAQPWLSTKLRKLEEQIGFPLFVRNTRNVMLTSGGEEFLQAARKVLTSVAAAEALAAQIERRGQRRLRIGVPPYSNKIPRRRELVERFFAIHHDVSVELEIGWTPTLLERVRTGDLDVAFVLGSIHDEELEMIRLSSIGFGLLMPACHFLAVKESISLSDLENQRVGVFTRALHRELFDEMFLPLREAGAELIQFPEINENLIGRMQEEKFILFQFSFAGGDLIDTEIVRRPFVKERLLPFSIVRRRDMAVGMSDLFWQLLDA